MNKQFMPLFVVVLLAMLSACQFENDLPENITSHTESDPALIHPGETYSHVGNGKIQDAPQLESIYTKASLSSFAQPLVNHQLIVGLKRQLRVLKYRKRKKTFKFDEMEVKLDQLERSVRSMLELVESDPEMIPQLLDAYQIKGADSKGNVKFTGYFTPVLKVKRKPDDVYKYPIYSHPKSWKGKLPSRRQIDGEGVLKGLELEIAYAKNLVDIYFMQVQGSGIVEFPDGKRMLFANHGDNNHNYSSIGRYMVSKGYISDAKTSLMSIRRFLGKNPDLLEEVLFSNESYVFFTPMESKPVGAGLVQLLAEYSIAVDKRFIPLGSCLLARVPIIERNKVTHHEYRLLLAQDIGGAIKGPGRIDLYTGIGEQARRKASALHHYGNLWLLLPKDNEPLAMAK